MSLVLKNLQSSQYIELKTDNPVIIGRTTFEGCSDKRVSRNHGKIICTVDGKITLLALHNNPCFFTKNGTSSIQQLNKDEEQILGEGDCVGLLYNAFWFKITSQKSLESQNNDPNSIKSEMIGDDNNDNKTDNSKIETFNKTLPTQNTEHQLRTERSPEPSCSKENGNNLLSPELEKTRKLPLWMYEIDKPGLKNSPFKRKLEESKEIGIKKIKNEDTSEGYKEPVTLESPSTSKFPDIVIRGIESRKIENKTSAENESSKNKQEKEGYESNVSEVQTISQTQRPFCQYENNCYRKNLQHRFEYSHPGDADYIPSEKRKICPYGLKCYRKNLNHKTEYRHLGSPNTRKSPSPARSPNDSLVNSPIPAKRKRKTIVRQDFDNEDDEFEEEKDAFNTSGSSDEYIPSCSDEE